MIVNSHPNDTMRAKIDLYRFMKYQFNSSIIILNDDAYLMKWFNIISEMVESVKPYFPF